MITTPVVQELVERVDRLEKCLGTLISWSIVQLGVEGVDQLLGILSGEESDTVNAEDRSKAFNAGLESAAAECESLFMQTAANYIRALKEQT